MKLAGVDRDHDRCGRGRVTGMHGPILSRGAGAATGSFPSRLRRRVTTAAPDIPPN